MNTTIAVIIPTFNRKECLCYVLKCLQNQIIEDFILHIIVIVDGSNDGTSEMIKSEFSDVDIIYGNGNWWYTKCINKGIERALSIKSSYILTLNDDVVFGNNYVLTLINITKKNNNDCLVGSVSYTQSIPCRITFSGVKNIIKWRLKENNYLPKFSIADTTSKTGYLKSVNLSGRGMFFPTDMIRKLGLYDEKLVQYSSDTDFSYRAYKAGINVFISYDAIIYENEKLTSIGATHNKPSFKEYFNSIFNIHSTHSIKKQIYFYIKHGNRPLFPLFLVVLILGMFNDLFLKYRNL